MKVNEYNNICDNFKTIKSELECMHKDIARIDSLESVLGRIESFIENLIKTKSCVDKTATMKPDREEEIYRIVKHLEYEIGAKKLSKREEEIKYEMIKLQDELTSIKYNQNELDRNFWSGQC